MEVPPEHQRFADEVAAAKTQDPMPTFTNLSAATGVPVDDLFHSRQREGWSAIAGIVDWLAAGK